ncbi:protein of unknown function [Hyphomicrobium facile]|uniref:DUF2779 domain-containing protein n=1 Tax=Hyphomicrobium facile TaxID=51670 RepID=A0A1I7NDZ4_9HYPH|nr:protein of unknown function [Hyphomicrobium facile]
MLITKTIFLDYLICRKNCWLKVHRPEFIEAFALSELELQLLEQGDDVERAARMLFPAGVLVVKTGADAVRETQELMAKGATIFQAAFSSGGFFVRCDVISPAPEGAWDLFEIKGNNALKEGIDDRDHITDLTFQAIVAERAGVTLRNRTVILLNKTYVRSGALDVDRLLQQMECSPGVATKHPDTTRAMDEALVYLKQTDEPQDGCDCHYKGRSRQCSTFPYSHPDVPAYSVHDIVRIGASKKKLADLIDRGIFNLEGIPEEFNLSRAQKNQVYVAKTGQSIIDKVRIREALASYQWPLHFLDYETFAPAIPMFDGYGPYQPIPFQFSLHILTGPDAEPAHFEFLHDELSDPTGDVVRLLDEHIGADGSVIVWYAPFERGVNTEMAARCPNLATVLTRINGQIRDLRDIFVDQHYVHEGFKGSTSIKAVLPVLVPDLSYEHLDIKNGGIASARWSEMITTTDGAERSAISGALKDYCELDTFAMYAIWKELNAIALSQ